MRVLHALLKLKIDRASFRVVDNSLAQLGRRVQNVLRGSGRQFNTLGKSFGNVAKNANSKLTALDKHIAASTKRLRAMNKLELKANGGLGRAAAAGGVVSRRSAKPARYRSAAGMNITPGADLLGFAAIMGTINLGVQEFIGRASDAEENLNLLGIAFGKNTADVVKWADQFGAAAGRNSFALQEMAARTGALLSPMLGGDQDKSAELSKALTERAVDVGSAFNATQKEVALAMRSGLVGETEPMRRFGVDLTVASLNAFALENGLKQLTKTSTTAEKVQLRYKAMMALTQQVHGDAINTIDDLANAYRAFKERVAQLTTEIGKRFLGAGKSAVIIGRKLIDIFGEAAKKSRILEAAMVVLGAIALRVGLRLLLPWLPFIALAAAAAIAIDDFWTFMEGGNSVIGRVLDSLLGIGTSEKVVRLLKEVWEGFWIFLEEDFIPAVKELVKLVPQMWDDMKNSAAEALEPIADWLDDIITKFLEVNRLSENWNPKNWIGSKAPSVEHRGINQEDTAAAEKGAVGESIGGFLSDLGSMGISAQRNQHRGINDADREAAAKDTIVDRSGVVHTSKIKREIEEAQAKWKRGKTMAASTDAKARAKGNKMMEDAEDLIISRRRTLANTGAHLPGETPETTANYNRAAEEASAAKRMMQSKNPEERRKGRQMLEAQRKSMLTLGSAPTLVAPNAVQSALQASPGGPKVRSAAGSAASSQTVHNEVHQQVSVNVEGNATAGDARHIAERTSQAVNRVNRQTRAALTQRAAQ